MMTRLWIMSDLHLEAVAFPEAFRPAPPDFDVLVVAGDVCEGDTDGALRKVRHLANDKPAVFVLGNHEFWGREVARERRTARRAAERHGVVLLDDGVADLAGLRFVGGTLWADGALAGDAATPELPTGERIRVGSSGRPITGADEVLLHRQTSRLIRKATSEDGPAAGGRHAPRAASPLLTGDTSLRLGGGECRIRSLGADGQRPHRRLGAWPCAS